MAAWRIFGSSNGLITVLKRNWYWLPTGLASNSFTFLSRARTDSRSCGGACTRSIARHQRIHLGLGIGDPDPFDTVELGDLAAGHARGRLGARLADGVLREHHLLA